MDDDWDDSVSMRLAALALDRGRLTDDLVTALAVRGTLLVDLALRGRVRETEDAVEFDDPPTGFAPADRLLAQGAALLTDLLRRGPVDQEDLAAEHLRRGSWTVRRRLLGTRYIDCRADRTAAVRPGGLRAGADPRSAAPLDGLHDEPGPGARRQHQSEQPGHRGTLVRR